MNKDIKLVAIDLDGTLLGTDRKIVEKNIDAIIAAFQPLKNRTINSVVDEVTRTDRRNFDATVLRCFGLDEQLLDSLYNILITSIRDRVSMSGR